MSNWHEVFDDLVGSRGQALVRYAYVLTGNDEDAADLVQDALLRAFSRTTRGLTIDNAEAYVRRAIMTTYLDGYRRAGRWRSLRHLLVPRTSDNGPAHEIAAADEVRVGLDGLSPRQRACIVLRYYDDLPLAGIAERLGCSVGAVKRHLSDAHARLRVRLADPTGELT